MPPISGNIRKEVVRRLTSSSQFREICVMQKQTLFLGANQLAWRNVANRRYEQLGGVMRALPIVQKYSASQLELLVASSALDQRPSRHT